MRFVIGGADSGKRDFVRENYGVDEILMADYDSVLTAKAVYGFHIFIKKLMADGKDIVAVIDKISVTALFLWIKVTENGAKQSEERAVISRKKRTKSCELYAEWGTELNEDNTYTSRYDGGKFKAKIYRNNGRRFDKYRLSERRLS